MKDNLSIGNLKRRWKSEGSPFFNKIGKMGIGIGVASAAILALPVTLSATGVVFVLPATLSTLATHGVVIGTLAKVISQFSVNSPAQTEEEVK